MKRILLSCLLLLPCFVAQAQAYQPFLGGKLHYFTSTSNYSVRVDSVGMIGADSAFWMNEIAVFPPPACTTSIGIFQNIPQFILGHEGFFGDHFIRKANGAYQFVDREGDTATFHTQLPIGVSWNFVSDSNLTASITARTQATVAGTADSVIVITISDGHEYQLSKSFGLAAGPNLSYYLRADSLLAAAIAYLPENPDWKSFFDWQPGDVYLTQYTINNQSAYTNHDLCTVLSRTISPNQDSIEIAVNVLRVQIWGGQGGTYFSGFQDTRLYTRAELGGLEQATYEVHLGPDYYLFQQPWTHGLNNRLELPFNYQASMGTTDSCGFFPAAMPQCNWAFPTRWAKGIANTYYMDVVNINNTFCVDGTFQLLCYELAGQDSTGNCADMWHILPADEPLAAADLTLSLDPLTGKCGLHWKGIPADNYQWELYDLNGRIIWEKNIPMEATGRAPIDVPGASGMYVLRIANVANNWGKSIKVPFLGR